MNFNSFNLHPVASASLELLTHRFSAADVDKLSCLPHGDVHPAMHLYYNPNHPFRILFSVQL